MAALGFACGDRSRGVDVTGHVSEAFRRMITFSKTIQRGFRARHRITQGASTLANPDLRDWLATMESAGEVQKVSGAERMEEIGGIVDFYRTA